jgi:hypothetical protein
MLNTAVQRHLVRLLGANEYVFRLAALLDGEYAVRFCRGASESAVFHVNGRNHQTKDRT